MVRVSATPKTISNWTSDITEHHRNVLKVRAVILSRLGLNQQEIADTLERDQKTISNWLGENGSGNFLLNEELLEEATKIWPDDNGEIAGVVEELREEMIFGHWSQEEHTKNDS